MPIELPAKNVPELPEPVVALSDPNLIAIVQFCLIGLLVTLIVMLSFPSLGAIIEQCNQF
jgi:hypothetical protein